MVHFGESDKMIKISGKVDKWNTYNEFGSNISFFKEELLQTNFFEFYYISAIEERDKIMVKM